MAAAVLVAAVVSSLLGLYAGGAHEERLVNLTEAIYSPPFIQSPALPSNLSAQKSRYPDDQNASTGLG